MSGTSIEWASHTWNPVTGCDKVSPGCKHCYAALMARRLKAMGQKRYRNGFEVTTHEETLGDPLRWRKPRRVFVCSMSDLFHESVPFDFILRLYDVMQQARHHTFQVLTKRLGRALEFYTRYGIGIHNEVPPNIWLGASIEDQAAADERILLLLRCPAAVHFVSAEPLLGPVRMDVATYRDQDDPVVLDRLVPHLHLLDWVIAGCESGPHRRPCEIDWLRSLRDQCVAAGVPYFCKQAVLGGKLVKMPKLDGRVWDQMPQRSDDAG